jgi:DNA-binding transcriptional regulator YhcF (GntR family)
MKTLSLEKTPGTPKYKQIVQAVEDAIMNRLLRKGDKLPSLNTIKNEHKLSRDTVLSAFNALKNRGIIHSVVGKGYYVSTEEIDVVQKIFLLFDEFNSFKEDLYTSFVQNLGANVQVDIFFHHFNMAVFTKLIHDNVGNYSRYVIMPANLVGTGEVLQNLPREKVYILDQMHKELSEYPGIFQNFEKDLYHGLQKGLSQIKKYTKLILLFSKEKQPQGLLAGFNLFCKDNNLKSAVIDSLEDRTLQKGALYILLDDKDLIRVVKKIKQEQLILAQDIGIISYNETMLKEIVAGGITTISTDFNLMGARLANMVLHKQQEKIANTSSFILRKSL